MRWFQVESALPSLPSIRPILKSLGLEGMGALLLLWCHTALHGRREPGRCVDQDGDPHPRAVLVDASGLTEAQFSELIEILLAGKSIDREAWERGELFFPGMKSRSDAYYNYTPKKKAAAKVKPSAALPPTTVSSTDTNVDMDVAAQPALAPELAPRLVAVPKKQARALRTDRAIELKEVWNRSVTPPIPQVLELSPQRIKLAEIAITQFGTEILHSACKAINASDFARGGGSRGWIANFDFLITKDHCLKILEGNYATPPPVDPDHARREGEREYQASIAEWNRQKRAEHGDAQ